MKKTKLGQAASKMTKAQFGAELSSHLRLTKAEIDALFPEENDREELSKLVSEVLQAANENEKKAKLIGNIDAVAGAVVKLLACTVTGV